jgi:flavin-binding protein dodecin
MMEDSRPAIRRELAPAQGGVKQYRREDSMSDVLKVIELMAESSKSWEDAAAQAVEKAGKSLHNIRSIYIKNFEAKVENNKITQYRVNANISFTLE